MIVRDLRVLKAIGRRYGMKFDPTFRYCVKHDYNSFLHIAYRGKEYRLLYFPGCFCPFLVQCGQ